MAHAKRIIEIRNGGRDGCEEVCLSVVNTLRRNERNGMESVFCIMPLYVFMWLLYY